MLGTVWVAPVNAAWHRRQIADTGVGFERVCGRPENRDSMGKGNAFDWELCCSLATLQRNAKRATSFAWNFAFLPPESRFRAALTTE